jgi:hypothetical protein
MLHEAALEESETHALSEELDSPLYIHWAFSNSA